MGAVKRVVASLGRAFEEKGVFVRLVCVGMDVFVVNALVGIFLRLFRRDVPSVFNVFTLPTSFVQFFRRP